MRKRFGKTGSREKKNFGPVRLFLLFFVVGLALLVPVRFAVQKIGDARIFSGTENLEEEMGAIVSSDSPFYAEFQNSKRVNVLVMGVNRGLTDTIMLVSYDTERQKVAVISIPRDTYYYRQGYARPEAHKINAIYAKDGAVGTARAVSDVLLGIPINYYMVVDYDAVKKVVDAMGGVPMDIPRDMNYSDPWDKPPLRISIPKGKQVLDGEKAVQFLRYRHGYPDADIGRVKAQQTFVRAAFKQAVGPDLFKVIRITLENVDSDIPLKAAAGLGKKAATLSEEDLETYLTPGRPGNGGTSYWKTDAREIESMIRSIYAPDREEASADDGKRSPAASGKKK